MKVVFVASDRAGFPDQLRRGPSWATLQRQVIDFCDRSRSALIVEASQHERASDGWRSVINACRRVPLLANPRRKKRALGKSQIMNRVVLGLQTGRIMDLELPLDVPLYGT